MNDDIAIKVEGVSKSFKLPHEKSDSIKGKIVNFAKQKKGYEIQHALKDISFEVKKGEFFGIVGRNGSGKSTLLKLISGIYAPDKGNITVNGKLTPFIELGVGFNPELTGRENVFLNGALLGFSRKEMEAMYDEIVEFAELERFMDQKLKNYSSGMQVRLAFSIAIRANTDILVLDEVLAVGDEAFQQKCIDIFEKYKSDKQTIILVTHSMDTVRRFCNKALLVNDSKVVQLGNPELVADSYSKLNTDITEREINNVKKLESEGISLALRKNDGSASATFNTGDKLVVDMTWAKKYINVKNVGIAIIKNSGEFVYGANTFTQKPRINTNSIRYEVGLDLGPGKYHLMAGLFGDTKYKVLDFVNLGPEFMIRSDSKDNEHGIVRLKSTWRVNEK